MYDVSTTLESQALRQQLPAHRESRQTHIPAGDSMKTFRALLLAATVYNLKKWLRFVAPKTNIKTMALVQKKQGKAFCFLKNILLQLILSPIAALKFFSPSIQFAKTQK